MGTVYEAIDQRVSCVVALKETLMAKDADSHRAFEREASLLANLRHPSLPKVMDYFVENEGEFLVMEFIPGHDLAELLALRGGPFPQTTVLGWADDLLSVLEHLHGLTPPILHRDIKPANLKLTKQGEIFLLDFGLAKGAAGQMLTLETSKSVHGYTPVYSPLEQIHGRGTDERSDLYALGATLYQLLTGKSPVDAPTRFTAIDDNLPDPLRTAHEVNADVHPAVSELIRSSMGVSRRFRFASAKAMHMALHNARAQLGPAAQTDREAVAAKLSQEAELRRAEEQRREEAARAEAELRQRQLEEEKRQEELRVKAEKEAQERQRAEAATRAAEEANRRRVEEERLARERLEEEEATRQSAAVTQRAQVFENDSKEKAGNEPAVKTIKATYPVHTGPIDVSPVPAEPKPRNSLVRYVVIGIVSIFLLAIVVIVGATFLKNSKTTTNEVTQSTVSATTPAAGPTTQAQAGMVYIPGGQFTMGRDDGDEFERPAHQVTVKPYFIDIDEVTNQQYEQFVNKSGHAAPVGWTGKRSPPGKENWPVTNVTWDDANAFAKWAGKRLPTEAEWEFAARGTDGRRYPWGNEWQDGLANAASTSKSLTPVGNFKGKSPFGLDDMVGNAWEWTADKLSPYSGGRITVTNPGVDMRVIRGGNFQSDKNSASTTYRRGYPARGNFDRGSTGFRCAKDVS